MIRAFSEAGLESGGAMQGANDWTVNAQRSSKNIEQAAESHGAWTSVSYQRARDSSKVGKSVV